MAGTTTKTKESRPTTSGQNATAPRGSRSSLQAEQAKSAKPFASITEQTLIAKEKVLASFYQRLGLAKDKGQKQDATNLQKMIVAGQKTWKRMWNAPYVPSKPTPQPAHKAMTTQVDKLQAVVSRRIGRYVDRLDKEKIEPLDKKIKTYKNLIASLEKDKSKVGFLEKRFLGDKLDKDIERTKALLAPHEKERNGLVRKRNELIGEYMEFVSYLSSGRETIKALSGVSPKMNEIKMTPTPVRNVSSAFNAVNEMLGAYKKQAVGMHKEDIVNPAQNAAKLRKNDVKTIEEDFNKLNFLGKMYAGDIGAHAREMSKDASVHYAKVLGQHGAIIDKFTAFADTMKTAEASFAKGNPIAFTSTMLMATGEKVIQNKIVTRKFDFSDNGIITRLGLNPHLMQDGAFTRSNEGTSISERKIHWPGFNSGVTLAGGYDVGHKSKGTVRRDLEYVNKGLRLVGEAEIPDKICSLLIDAVGLKGQEAKKYFRQHPELKEYKLPSEATDVFFYKYYKREQSTTKRVVGNNLAKYRGKNPQDTQSEKYTFDDLPIQIQQLVTDTVTRGDFKSLRNNAKRKTFYDAMIKGLRTENWEPFLEIYTDRTVFTLNPNINRHDRRADKAEEIKEKLALSERPNKTTL